MIVLTIVKYKFSGQYPYLPLPRPYLNNTANHPATIFLKKKKKKKFASEMGMGLGEEAAAVTTTTTIITAAAFSSNRCFFFFFISQNHVFITVIMIWHTCVAPLNIHYQQAFIIIHLWNLYQEQMKIIFNFTIKSITTNKTFNILCVSNIISIL